MAAGYVYVMTNESMPGIVKIGVSCDPESRAQELYKTSVPTPFIVEFFRLVDDPYGVEREVHRALAELRVTKSREFFRIATRNAIHVVMWHASWKYQDEEIEDDIVALLDLMEAIS